MITERLKYNRKVHEHIGKFIEQFPELRYGQILGSLGMTYPNDVFNDEPQVLHDRMVAKEKELGWYDKLNTETKSDLPIKQTRDVLLTFETYIPFDGEWSEGEDICSDNGWDIKGKNTDESFFSISVVREKNKTYQHWRFMTTPICSFWLIPKGLGINPQDSEKFLYQIGLAQCEENLKEAL